MVLRKKLLAFDEGLEIYCHLDSSEDDILIPFAISLWVTGSKIVMLLREHIGDLDRNEVKEVLGIDLDKMTKVDYWLKGGKLKRDMETLNDLTLKERGIEYAYNGHKVETTLDLYRMIEESVLGIVELLTVYERKMMKAPDSLYGNFYLSQKANCDRRQVEAGYLRWKRDVAAISFDLLKDKQTLVVAEFLKKKILRFTQIPSDRERELVDLDKVRPHLPYGYELPEEFRNCCARFRRFISWDGDILKINYDCYGKYLFQFYYSLPPAERQAFIELDLMLDLIHQDMVMILSNGKSDNTASVEDRIRRCIALLMAERLGDEPLFNQQNHWQAVYRILVDKGYCSDSDFDGFDAFIRRVMPEKVNKPYSKGSLKQISQTDFVRPFNEWKYDVLTSKTRKPYDRMVAVARRFLEILEENGL